MPKTTIKDEILSILIAQKALTSSRIVEELAKRGRPSTPKAVSVYLVDMRKDKLIWLDSSTRPGFYYAGGSKPEKISQPGNPVRTQSESFPEFMVAVKRKGREFRYPYKNEKDLGAFLDKLGMNDEVAIYKKAEVKKEVKAIWKLG